MSEKTSDPAAIERDLAATRARLAAHLDELGGRLSPGQLLDEGLSYLRDGQGAEFVRNLGAQMRDNPLPVAVAGIGLAWLAAASSMAGRTTAGSSSKAVVPYDAAEAARSTSGPTRDDLADRARRAGEALAQNADETAEAFRARIADAQAKVLGMTQSAQETAADFGGRVRQALQGMQDKTAEWADRASDWTDRAKAGASQAGAKAGDLLDRGREQAARARQAGAYASDAGARLAGAASENPLLLAAIGMTAGALLGALLPRTSAEDRYLGDAANRIGSSAGEMARDVVQRGTEVAKAAADAGIQAARDHGLVPPRPHGDGDGRAWNAG